MKFFHQLDDSEKNNEDEKDNEAKVGSQVLSDENSHINQEIYKKNAELARTNKTLSILKKIEELILSSVTDPKQIAQDVANILVADTDYQLVAIFLLKKSTASLETLSVSQTPMLDEAEREISIYLSGVRMSLIDDSMLVKAVKDRKMYVVHALSSIYSPSVEEAKIKKLQEILSLQATIIHPLIVRDEALGAIVVGVSQDFSKLTPHERDLLDRLALIVGIAMDNALLYTATQDANVHLRELDKAKDQFLSIASHELRTPMTAIAGFVDMIDEGRYGPVNEELQEPLSYIAQGTERLIQLVNDILNVSRIEAGKLPFSLKEVSLSKAVNEMIVSIEPVAKKKNIELMAKDIPEEIVLSDPNKITQILTNLVGNSLKFTDHGSIIISGGVSGDLVNLYVTDMGVGIAKEDQERLFGKFEQISSQQAGRPSGTGLGLYLSRIMAQKMGGDVWLAKSELGKGSTFAFSLPRAGSEIAEKVKKELSTISVKH